MDHPKRFYEMGGRRQHGRHGIALIINNFKWEDGKGIPYMSARDGPNIKPEKGAKCGAAKLKNSQRKLGIKSNLKKTSQALK